MSRAQSEIPAGGTQIPSTVTLDRLMPLIAGRTYQPVVQTDPDVPATPVPVASWTTASIPAPCSGAGAGNGLHRVRHQPGDLPGQTGTPMPTEMTGVGWTGQDKLPRLRSGCPTSAAAMYDAQRAAQLLPPRHLYATQAS